MAKKRKSDKISDKEIEFYKSRYAEMLETFNIGTFGDYRYVDIYEFIRIIFERQGQLRLQQHGRVHYFDTHYNAIIRRVNHENGKRNWWIVTDQLPDLGAFYNAKFAIISPVTYIGATRSLYGRKKNEAGEVIGADRTKIGNARYLFAFVIDLDNVYVKNMKYLTAYIREGHFPQPTMITCSGRGLHLYFCLEKPVSIRIENVEILNRMKVLMTMMLWRYNLTTQKPTMEFHDVNQGYRLPQTQTKFGQLVHTYAFGDEIRYYTIRELNDYVNAMYKARPEFFKINKSQYKPLEDVVLKYIENGFRKSKLSSQEQVDLDKSIRLPAHWSIKSARQKFGEDWYNYVQANGSKDWHYSRNFYDWWLGKLKYEHEVTIGHRYWCIYVLACWAYNCKIPFEQLRADAMSLLHPFNLLKDENRTDEFTVGDVEAAISIYKERESLGKVVRLNRAKTERTTGVSINANKRNFRTRQEHGFYRVQLLDTIHDPRTGGDGANWREGNGRPAKGDIVAEWRATHPNVDNKSLCARDCGIDLKTVRKWWNGTDEAVIPKKKQVETDTPGVGAAVNAEYITDTKIAAATMEQTDGFEKQDAATIQRTGDDLADAINYGSLNIESLMRSMGVPDFMIPLMKAEFERQMQSPEFWAQYKKARPQVDMSDWPEEARKAYEAAVNEHKKK